MPSGVNDVQFDDDKSRRQLMPMALVLCLPVLPTLVSVARMPLTQHTHTLAHKAHGALLVATDSGTGARVGSCALEAAQISGDGVRVPSTDGSATLRPLLTRMIVDPQARRQGIGKQLVSDAAMQAAEWGYDELVCNVQRGNEAARQLYRGAPLSIEARARPCCNAALTPPPRHTSSQSAASTR